MTNITDSDTLEARIMQSCIIAAAPEMFSLLKQLNNASNDREINNVILESKSLLAYIDREKAEYE